MPEFGDNISVYPLVQEWNFTVSESSVSGTRVFLENLGQLPGVDSQNLPNIGDPWDSTYEFCTAKTISVSYMGSSDCGGRKFTVNYDGSPAIISALVSSSDLPVSVDVGGELVAVEPYTVDESGVKTFHWNWQTDGEGCNQPIFFHQGIANIRFTKVVPDAEAFVKTSMAYVGHVNSGTFFSFPTGWVLYEGCSMYQFKNKLGFNRWKAELHFAVRNVTDDAGEFNGWNFILRKDAAAGGAGGVWDRPVNVNGAFLYTGLDFDNLLSSHPLSDDEDYYNQFPTS